jgi:hypothetical protein
LKPSPTTISTTSPSATPAGNWPANDREASSYRLVVPAKPKSRLKP